MTFWVAEQTPAYLEAIRLYELEQVIRHIRGRQHILEIGGGTGWQARALFKAGFNVTSIDVGWSSYKSGRVWAIEDYDGHTIPASDATFDVVFSSNVLEHVPHVREFQAEIRRVLRRDGLAIHILPSTSWRAWSAITHIIKYLRPDAVHGAIATTLFREALAFRKKSWGKLFDETGWHICKIASNNIFYTGCSIMASRLSIRNRVGLAAVLGGSCNIFVLAPISGAPVPSEKGPSSRENARTT